MSTSVVKPFTLGNLKLTLTFYLLFVAYLITLAILFLWGSDAYFWTFGIKLINFPYAFISRENSDCFNSNLNPAVLCFNVRSIKLASYLSHSKSNQIKFNQNQVYGVLGFWGFGVFGHC